MQQISPSERAEIQALFQTDFSGESYFDPTQRWLYSTDASIYQIQPAGVVVPKDTADLNRVLEILRLTGGSMVPRGGGTSLGGQAVGPGLQVDLSKYFNRILEINTEAGWVRVQPGVILDQLNAALEPLGYWFGPDVAPSNRATLGGMIGNNSAGAHSIVYGKTVDHVLELDVLLSDGSACQMGALEPANWEAKGRQNNLEGRIYRSLSQALSQHHAEIEARFPKILRRVSGYNLDAFLDSRKRNLAHLIVGSEGTLALVKEAKVRIVPRPPHRGLLVLYFENLTEALEANHAILATQPSAAEVLDKMLLDLTRQHPAFARKLYFMEHEAQVLLLVEYMAHSETERDALLEAGLKFARQHKLGRHVSVARDRRMQADIWAIRKAGLPLLYSRPGADKPVTFVEDTAVAPEHLKDFIAEFDALVQAHDTQAAYYAHASVGCLHIRPLLDLKQATEVQKMRSLSEAVVALVQRYHGAMSGEHGDGLARSEFNERLFGPTVYRLFRELKQVCDPAAYLNPGKITAAPPMDQNLRFGPKYQPQPFPSQFHYHQQESFQTLVELCNGNGACRKLSGGSMCPPFRVTRQEADSTRGRANALRRLMLEPDLDPQGERELYQVMELCIGCKACKSECPSRVDMAKLKSEFLHHYQQNHGVPLRSRLLAEVKWLNHLGCLGAPFSNQLLKFKPLRRCLEQSLGLSAQTVLPHFARIPLDYWFRQRPLVNPGQPQVVLFNDCYLNYNHPEVGQAAIRVLEAFGYQVILPPQVCCGRPQISLGLLDRARHSAQKLIESYRPYLDQGLTVVGCEPSCVLSFRDEYPDFWPQPRALQSQTLVLAQQSQTLQEWVLQQSEQGKPSPFQLRKQEIFYHEHCHAKVLSDADLALQALQTVPGYQLTLSSAGCCGMAGAFGYEAEHRGLSQAIGRQGLLSAWRTQLERHPQTQFGVSGVSCRHQILSETGREPLHLAELLAAALPSHSESSVKPLGQD